MINRFYPPYKELVFRRIISLTRSERGQLASANDYINNTIFVVEKNVTIVHLSVFSPRGGAAGKQEISK